MGIIDNNVKKIGILGVGNLLLGDEGFGVHAIKYLKDHYQFPDNIQLLDAGTAGIYMAPFMEECDDIFVIDVVDVEDEPGTLYQFDIENIPAGNINLRMSPHQLGLIEIVDICKLRGKAPNNIEFFCIVPESFETSLELSARLKPQLAKIADIITNKCIAMGNKIVKNA